MKRVAGLFGILVLLIPSSASAAWIATSSNASGFSSAASMPAASAPTAIQSGTRVIVDWDAAAFGDGTEVQGYTVRRYTSADVPASIGSGCTGTITDTICTESSVPVGTWKYSVTPIHHSWTGTESAKSTVEVMASDLSFTNGTATSLPWQLEGSLANFGDGEDVEFFLDSTTGSALVAEIDGDTDVPLTFPSSNPATVSVTVPAGTSEGGHTIYAVGDEGSEASTAIVVDAVADDITPPTGSVTAPADNATVSGSVALTSDSADPTVGGMSSGVKNVKFEYKPAASGSFTQIGSADTSAPYGVSWDTTSVVNGSYLLRAITEDNASNTFTSDTITVTVSNLVAPTVTSVTTTNSGVGNGGKLNSGDTMAIEFSRAMDLTKFCAGWTGTTISANNAVEVRITDGTGATNDSLTVTMSVAPCAGGFKLGTVDLGSSAYISGGNMRLGTTGSNASEIRYSTVTNTLTIELGNAHASSVGTLSAVAVASTTLSYSPDTALRAADGAAFAAGYSKVSATAQHF